MEKILSLITEAQNKALEEKTKHKDILKEMLEKELDKASGPDGFTAIFYQKCWVVIKGDLWRMVNCMNWKGKVKGATNSSFMSLIPKEKYPSTFNSFRPISLCNVSYKIITKILANRIKDLLHGLISSNQGGFITGRQILENIILIQEAIH